MASADFSHSTLLRRPFRHKARSPQVRTQSFTAQPPDLRCRNLDHESFAVFGLLALFDIASYPVFVHRLTVSLHASFPHSVTLMQLRFASFAVVNLREDLHLQDCAHAGRTKKSRLLMGGFYLWWGQDLNLQPSGYEPDELPIAPPHDVCASMYRINSLLQTFIVSVYHLFLIHRVL